jgi:hypothetical protein
VATDTWAASATSAIVTGRPFATRAFAATSACLVRCFWFVSVHHDENSLLSCDISLITIITSHKMGGTWAPGWLRKQPHDSEGETECSGRRPISGRGRLQVRAWGRHMGTSVAPRTAARQLKGDGNAADGDQSVAVVATGWGV